MIDFTGIRVAAVFAHPDDEAFTAGGVISAFALRGATVTLVSATRGEQGEISDSMLATPENLGSVREHELRIAATILGVSDVRFLDYRDSGMFGTPSNENPAAFIQHSAVEVADKLLAIFEEIRPDLVVTFAQDGGYLHPDHVHIHDSVVAAAQRAPALVPQLYFSSFPRHFLTELANQNHGTFDGMSEERRNQMGQPLESFDIILDVEPYMARKIEAFSAHRTQQPKDGDHPFLESQEAQYQFTSHEYYIHWPTTSTAPDPLELLAADLPGSTVR